MQQEGSVVEKHYADDGIEERDEAKTEPKQYKERQPRGKGRIVPSTHTILTFHRRCTRYFLSDFSVLLDERYQRPEKKTTETTKIITSMSILLMSDVLGQGLGEHRSVDAQISFLMA